MSDSSLSAREIIRLLGLQPHPEGGHFRETFRDPETDAKGRSVGTAIYYLLEAGEVSEWHRCDASEIWHHYAGAPMVITISPNGHDAAAHHLGPNLAAGQRPQILVPKNHWQSATSLGAWSLVGCTVSPGFEFAGFEMAPKDWRPRPRKGGV
ncbi:MAG: cupin domain-containing protein [Methylobacterium sp.]|nr:cupin domain-containing protein [Methylobacterium sp.]MCA3602930.1 cupin domain-containing protein [Methylobacterium sp.]MCA3614706.1 cupin domain-containing protein [Methylobacterium sp.]MCA3627371.1 cupin domain-containing protein [Methylobacterium sp.]MCA3640623.1 cupin domain-containing protein [Methylobacterium sp.]